jgi:hypothetical protein
VKADKATGDAAAKALADKVAAGKLNAQRN